MEIGERGALTYFILRIILSTCSGVISFVFLISSGGSFLESFSTNASYSDDAALAAKMVVMYLLTFVIICFLYNILIYGMYSFCLRVSRSEPADVENLFDGFKRFGTVFLSQLLKGIFIFLWALLFYIPGIIAYYRYSLTLFIINDNPEIKATDAITLSKKMMKGYKGKMFLMHLSFIGWALLCIPTLGIFGFWLYPFVTTAEAAFYNKVKANYEEQNGTINNQDNSSNLISDNSYNDSNNDTSFHTVD